MADRQYDLALFGATGFTGGLTARYLARNGPAGLRWALVGRNRDKLEAVASALEEVAGEGVPAPELLLADASDSNALARVAGAARVVITTVGPYALYGEPLVAACAAAGTDYVDLTGEPEFVDRMWLGYHEQARRSGARLVHCCGFDSIPHDLGAYFTVKQLPEGVPLTVNGYVQHGGRVLRRHLRLGDQRFRPGAADGQRGAAAPPARAASRRAAGPLGAAPSPARRRARRLGRAAADDRRPDRAPLRRGARALRAGLQLRAQRRRQAPDLGRGRDRRHRGGAGLAQLPPTRKLLLKSSRSPGEGPSEEVRAKSWFKVTFVGEGGGKRVLTEVAGGDPGYDETAKMLAESGLCLAFDELPQTSGQVTTADGDGRRPAGAPAKRRHRLSSDRSRPGLVEFTVPLHFWHGSLLIGSRPQRRCGVRGDPNHKGQRSRAGDRQGGGESRSLGVRSVDRA